MSFLLKWIVWWEGRHPRFNTDCDSIVVATQPAAEDINPPEAVTIDDAGMTALKKLLTSSSEEREREEIYQEIQKMEQQVQELYWDSSSGQGLSP